MDTALDHNTTMRLRSPGSGVALGFAVVLVLMLAIVAVALLRIGDINRRLDAIVNSNNVKIEAAHEMIRALNNRAISMHTIGTLQDPFERDDEYQQFNIEGASYSVARKRLETAQLSDEETAILARVRALTQATQPLTEEAVDDALAGQLDLSLIARTKAIPAQKKIADELDLLLKMEHRQTEVLLTEADRNYKYTMLLMIVLGLGAVGIGAVVAIVVIRNSSRQGALLRRQALYDSLTGLPNRALFSDRLEQTLLVCQRENQGFALIAVDIDNFKGANDTLGHGAGDQLLQQVAQRLRVSLRSSDTVARMGGDEFTILLPTVSGVDGAVATTRKLINALRAPFSIDGKATAVSASFGIAMCPQHGSDAATLSRHADAAMYAAKRGRTGFETYQASLDKGGSDEYRLESDLRRAVTNNDELVLFYQPKVNLSDGETCGVEALVRWQHPTRGLLMPDTFVPLAERVGAITALTERVLILALRQSRSWQDAGLEMPIAVNVSAVDIQDAQFPDFIERILREHNIAPELLELEVTETAVMAHPERAVVCVKRLSALGVQVAIDDFGTGYSSMSYLKELLVAKIKIDRSFIADMLTNRNDRVIVRSTVELGHNLGLKIVAEGVENLEVLNALRTLGCDAAQGYYLSRPLPAAQAGEWMRQNRAKSNVTKR